MFVIFETMIVIKAYFIIFVNPKNRVLEIPLVVMLVTFSEAVQKDTGRVYP